MKITGQKMHYPPADTDTLISELQCDTVRLSKLYMKTLMRDVDHYRGEVDALNATQSELEISMQNKLAAQKVVDIWQSRLSMFSDFASALVGVAAGGLAGVVTVASACLSAADRYAKSNGLYKRVSPWVETAVGTVAKVGKLAPLICGGSAIKSGLSQAVDNADAVVTTLKGGLTIKSANELHDLRNQQRQSQDLEMRMSLERVEQERAQERLHQSMADIQQLGDGLATAARRFRVEKRIARSMR